MECKIAQYQISLLVDGELEEASREALLQHIEQCEACSSYLEQAMEIDNASKELFGQDADMDYSPAIAKIMDAVKEEQVYTKKRLPKVKSLVAVACITLLILCIPIQNKTVLAYMNDVVKGLIIRQQDLLIEIEQRNPSKTYEEPGGIPIREKVAKKTFRTAEEVISTVYNTEKKPCLPPYIPTGFEFDMATYGKHDDKTTDDFYVESTYIRSNSASALEDRMIVNLEYKKSNIFISGYKKIIEANEEAKEILADEEKGVLIKSNTSDAFDFYDAMFILNKHGVVLNIKYRPLKGNGSAEADIRQVSEALIKQLKQEIPEEMEEVTSVSEVIESKDETEFYNKIAALDDRILKMNAMPEGYKFYRGSFISNPKENAPNSLSSDYRSLYKNGDSLLDISMYLYTHTEKDSDFPAYYPAEIIERKSLEGYTMKVYKERKNNQGLTNRAIALDLPDYATVLILHSMASEQKLLSYEALEQTAKDIITDLKKQSAIKLTLAAANRIKVYDSLAQLANSEELKQNKLIVPSYIPESYQFERAKYDYALKGYRLQVGRSASTLKANEFGSTVSISVGKHAMYDSYSYLKDYEMTNLKVAGVPGRLISGIQSINEQIDARVLILEMTIPGKDQTLKIISMFDINETPSEAEMIKIAESILN